MVLELKTYGIIESVSKKRNFLKLKLYSRIILKICIIGEEEVFEH
jgi:hypothetical protein